MAVQVTGSENVQSLNEGFEYLTESDEELSLAEIRSDRFASQWTPVSGQPNFGYRQDAIWYRLTLTHGGPEPIQRYLEITYPLLDVVELYQVSANQPVFSSQTGDRVPHRQRPLDVRTFAFPLRLEPGKDSTVYLRVQTSGSHQLPARLWNPDAFYPANERDMMWRAMFYGMLLIMAASTLYLALTIRELSFLYFFAVQVSLLVIMAGLHGIGFQYLFPDRPWVHELLILTSVPLGTLFFVLFTIEFLQLRDRLRWAWRLLQLIAVAAFLASLSGFVFSYGVSTRISVVLAALACLSILTIALALLKRGDRSALHFTVAWLALLLGVVLHVLDLSAWLPQGFDIPYAVETGSVLASLLLYFALADRLHLERTARIREQHARIDAMRAREQAESRVIDAARHHGLTGLPNRVALEECLQSCLAAHDRVNPGRKGSLALMLLHLRGFDDVNKTLGHENADTILVKLARRLDEQVKALPDHVMIENRASQSYSVAHVEGVTFAAVFRPSQPEHMLPLMNQLADGVRQPVEFRGLSVDLGVVGGCSFYPDDSEDVPTLLRHAFIAFDRADAEVDQLALFTPDLNPYSERRLTLMTNLRLALENDELTLNFQPQLRVSDGKVSGFEALLRWHHPEHGFVPPDEFIPMAEQTGLIRPVTAWVLNRALAFCCELETQGFVLAVSVNISAVNLREIGFVDAVMEALDKHGIPPQRLVLEVTETATMVDPKAAMHCLRLLNEASVRLSIDDFGTGYSSLSYIRKLPVHEIKIDRSFVMEMDSNRGDATIVRTTINMCHDLGYEVVAEGIETQSTCELLRSMGCDLAQGYHLARPIPQAEVLDWLQNYTQNTDDKPFSSSVEGKVT